MAKHHETTNVELYRLPDQLVLVKLPPRFADTYLQNQKLSDTCLFLLPPSLRLECTMFFFLCSLGGFCSCISSSIECGQEAGELTSPLASKAVPYAATFQHQFVE
jgi:hypothetical protein